MADSRPEWAGLSDQDVVLRARSGQEAAYRELIRRYERPLSLLMVDLEVGHLDPGDLLREPRTRRNA